MIAVFVALIGSGLFFRITGAVGNHPVLHSLQGAQQEVERQQNRPRIVVLASGEQIEANRVLDQGKSWGIICKDGKVMAINKVEVQEVRQALSEDATAK